jgi:hypothetical protein
VKGCGVFAGGAYYCAEGSVNNAQMGCMNEFMKPTLLTLQNHVKDFEKKGTIDPISNLKD